MATLMWERCHKAAGFRIVTFYPLLVHTILRGFANCCKGFGVQQIANLIHQGPSVGLVSSHASSMCCTQALAKVNMYPNPTVL